MKEDNTSTIQTWTKTKLIKKKKRAENKLN